MRGPQQRTQELLKKKGFHVANTEKWNPWAKRRQDLFGFVDTLAVHPAGEYCLAIQSTDGGHHATRREKIIASPIAAPLCKTMRVELWSWSKRGPRGCPKKWTLRREKFSC